MTINYGLKGGTLDATKHEEALRPGKDGYVNMDKYNKAAPWSDK